MKSASRIFHTLSRHNLVKLRIPPADRVSLLETTAHAVTSALAKIVEDVLGSTVAPDQPLMEVCDRTRLTFK